MQHDRGGVEFADKATIRAMQLGKLRTQLAYLKSNSPFYADALKDVDPQSVQSVDDLARLPFTYKQALRESQKQAPPFGTHLAARREAILRVHASSGTTGLPSMIPVTAQDSLQWQEAVRRAFVCQGLTPDSTFAMAFGIGFFVGGIPLVQGIEAVGATLLPIGTGASERLVDSIQMMGADVLGCTPSYALHLAEWAQSKLGLDVRTLGIKRLMVGAEPGGGVPEIRRQLEERWDAEIREAIGNADVVPLHSAECDHGGGCHFLVPDMLVMEVIDPESLQPIEIGEGEYEGELVFTHLQREAVPLLRFRTHDRVAVNGAPCACGRSGPRIRVIGRTDDLMILRGVNVWPSAIKDVVTSFRPEVSGSIRIVLPQPGPLVSPPLRIQVELGEGTADSAELKKRIEVLLREKLVFTSAVELLPHGAIPLSQMKTKLIFLESEL